MTGKHTLPRLSPDRRALGYFSGALVAAILAIGVLLYLFPGIRPLSIDPSNPNVSLDDVEREVRRRYPVADITFGALAGMMTAGTVTLFDVRTLEEFEAGHLPGAIRIEPGASTEDILREHRDKIGAHPIVFYCAVGVRSSRVLMRTLQDLAPLTEGRLYNLRGGVFRWAAERRALVKGDQPGAPHPYDENWGKLLSRTIPRS